MTGTSSRAATPAETNYPHVARWVQDFGWIEIGQDDFSHSMVRALDIGGLIWEGKASYATLDAACRISIRRWRHGSRPR